VELTLAIALAVTALAAVSAWSGRKVERARVHRLEEELASLRRASAGVRLVEPALPEFTPSEDLDEAADSSAGAGGDVSRVRQLVESALQTLRAQATPGTLLEEARREVRSIVQQTRRLEGRLDALLQSGAELLARAPSPPPPGAPATPAGFTPPSLAVSAAADALERLADESLGLPEELGVAGRSSARAGDAVRTLATGLGTVERRAEACAALSPAVSAVADRLNLLALDLAVVAEPGDRQRSSEQLGGELRGAYEEVRRLSRELDSSARRLGDTARATRETCDEALAASGEGQERAQKAVRELARLPQAVAGVAAHLQAARESAHALEELHRGCAGLIESVARRNAELAAEAGERQGSLAALLAQLRTLAPALADLRTAAEQQLAAIGEAESPLRAEAAGDLEAALRQLN